jgi:uroporphyrinogen decarboxylase
MQKKLGKGEKMPQEMTPKERFLAAVTNHQPDRVPVCPWLTSAFFSAYYGIDHLTWYGDREIQLKAMLEFYTRYPDMQYFPGFRASAGSTAEASGMGCEIETPPGQSPHARPVIQDITRDLSKLKVTDPYQDGRLPGILDAYGWLSGELPKHGFEVTAGFLHAPFDVASLVHNLTDLMMDLIIHPAEVHQMMEIVTESCIAYMQAQWDVTGGTMTQIMVADDVGGQLSPKHWWEFSGKYIKKVLEAAPEGAVRIVHNCLKTSHILEMYPDTGADALQMDPEIDIADAKARIGDKMALIGNMHQLKTLQHGTPEEVELECKGMIRKAGRGGGYILSASGCLSKETPLENLDAMVRAAEKYGTYPLQLD